jgi:hypothetical protein
MKTRKTYKINLDREHYREIICSCKLIVNNIDLTTEEKIERLNIIRELEAHHPFERQQVVNAIQCLKRR